MNYSVIAPTLSEALQELKRRVVSAERAGRRTVIFCEDRLTLVAERTVCAAVGGTFNTSVYTFSRFLSSERAHGGALLSSHGSAIAIRGIIERNRGRLRLFGKLSAAAAAGSLYDTIALLYSSGVSAEEVAAVRSGMRLLDDKLHDISLIYSEYVSFLQESGRLDRNMYLRTLPSAISSSSKIAGADVVLLGFQAFTGTTAEGVRACMRAADNTCGIFVGGGADLYANEASAQFEVCAREFGGCSISTIKSSLTAEAERIRSFLFDPQAFQAGAVPTDKIHIFDGSDEEQEAEFIAASVIRYVSDGGVRYGEISVMLGDVQAARPALARVFSAYGIPYYVDERRALSEHALSALVCGFLECVAGGCAPEDVCAVTSNYLFGLTDGERDVFRNYAARCADYRGGVKRVPRADICEALGFGYAAVCAVRDRFLGALRLLPQGAAEAEAWAEGIKKLLEYFCCEDSLRRISEESANAYPAQSEFNARAYGGVISVLEEAEELGMGARYTAREFKKLLQSGLSAAKISLIPPKTDAVFVGDISSTVNAGSEVVFAAHLTDAVPPAGSDTSLLTDREITSLERLNVKIAPKIAQVNRRRRETAGLNLCAFRGSLYLSYPVLSGGEEKSESEILSYITALFCTANGKKLVPVTQKMIDLSGRGAPYYCSAPTPALKALAGGRLGPRINSALYRVLEENGLKERADNVIRRREGKAVISNAKALYAPTGYVSPTLLETYFSCPYLNFARQGLRLAERQEGAVRPLDTGNFIHAVLQELAAVINGVGSEEEAGKIGGGIAAKLLERAEYAAIPESVGGSYTAARLVDEAERVSKGVYRQLADSNFRVRDVEKWYTLTLDGGIRAGGRVDRVDECGDMVRVIDYKTGYVDADPDKYYAGVKLQLPLYLLAASKGRRPAGAYYFPANIEYRDKEGGVVTLSGFMDGSDDVVRNSDTTVAEKQRSRYVDAYLGGRQLSGTLPREDFADFLEYSALIAQKGADEIFRGNIAPSPFEGVCEFCKMGGMCGFAPAECDGREVTGVTCTDVARAVRRQRGEE